MIDDQADLDAALGLGPKDVVRDVRHVLVAVVMLVIVVGSV